MKSEQIKIRKIKVESDLGQAEPALIAATESVNGISRDNLTELRSLKSPPANVKIALEPVIALLTNKAKKCEWDDIKTELKKDSFI